MEFNQKNTFKVTGSKQLVLDISSMPAALYIMIISHNKTQFAEKLLVTD